MIDWSKLTTYQSSKNRSFEELCYQIAQGLYGHMGSFTPVDDSGGGDGVEFYLTLPNGDQWGWQAKFYYPNQRLNVSNRKTQIIDSLITSCKKHKKLKKWFLCTPTRFTVPERVWFEEKLPCEIPKNMGVKLEHWRDSDLNSWLSEPTFAGKRHYFFGELELGLEWFQAQVEKQMAIVRDKYIPDLHTETSVDQHIHQILCDNIFAKSLGEQLGDIRQKVSEFEQGIMDLSNPHYHQLEWGQIRMHLQSVIRPMERSLLDTVDQLSQAQEFINQKQLTEVRLLQWTDLLSRFTEAYKVYRDAVYSADISELPYNGDQQLKKYIIKRVQETIHRPRWIAESLYESLQEVINHISQIRASDLHVFGRAGLGKTHLASHFCHERVNSGLPALFVPGAKFTSESQLEQQLKEILDVPLTYSWSEFLQALDSAAQAYKTRIPIIIDGLNEATVNGVFSKVWRLWLPGLIKEIGQSPNVVLITTCRSSYKEAIWDSHEPQNSKYVSGFNAQEVEKTVEKYFFWYKIKADLTATPLTQFQTPIFLKIFCETQNSSRQEEKQIFIGEQTFYEVFDQYLSRCNKSICERLGLYGQANILETAMNKIAQYMWKRNTSDIPLSDLFEMIDGQAIDNVPFDGTRTKAILDEGLLMQKEWLEREEVVRFTYQLLGGYLIATHILGKNKKAFIVRLQSQKTITTLFSNEYRKLHPLHDDICGCLAVLTPVKLGQYLHELLKNDKAFACSITALFELSPSLITQACVDLISKLFKHPENRRKLLDLAVSTTANSTHPLNAHFWSDQIASLPMAERDVSWSEYVRRKSDRIEKMLEKFEEDCKKAIGLNEESQHRLALTAEHIKWVLTSTVRPLRDKATRALYWFGRKFPEQLFGMTVNSLGINDPYVPERLIAASYGVAMALQHDKPFIKDILPEYAKKLFDNLFSKKASFSTTHIFMRDYAKHTIDIALLHSDKLLNSRGKNRIMPPYKDGGIRTWGESTDKNKDEYRDSNSPFGLDFNNYTIGYLIPKRNNYDFNDPEYVTVKANMWWRIYSLGFSLEKFGEIDKEIMRTRYGFGSVVDGGKTDRYGKKYCWIAWHEIAGYRQDKGLLKREGEGEDHNRFTVDIDPSFPEDIQKVQIIRSDYLVPKGKSLPWWITKGPTPDLRPYLVLDKIQKEYGPWVLLDGFIEQEDPDSQKDVFIFPRGLFVKKRDFVDVLDLIRQQDLGGRWLPEIPEHHYAFAGEVPWCETFPFYGNKELSFVMGIEKKRVPYEETEFRKDGRKFSGDKLNELFEVVDKYRRKEISEEDADRYINGNKLQIRKVRRYKAETSQKTKEHEVIIPISTLNLGAHESIVNPGIAAYVLSKELCQVLDLSSRPQTYDLYDKTGRRASITLKWGNDLHTFHKLIYIRKDLLDRALHDKDLSLIWGIWGERRYKDKENAGLAEFAKKHQSYKVFQRIVTYQDIIGEPAK